MNAITAYYDSFARMLSYPAEKQEEETLVFEEENNAMTDSFSSIELDFKNEIQSFLCKMRSLPIEEQEELYTRTFDINPLATLEIGWHLFGEQYERGAFLVTMRGLLRRFSIEESSELPDHLTHVLPVLGRMEKDEADEFARKYLVPSLEKIVSSFGETDNSYFHLIRIIKNFIEQQHLNGVLVHE